MAGNKEVLHAKADYSPIFRSALINSVGKRIVECTQDILWVSGLSPRLSASTKSDYYTGKNKLGEILESARNYLIKEEVMSQLLNTPNNIEDTCVSHIYIDDHIRCPILHLHPLKYQFTNAILKIDIIQNIHHLLPYKSRSQHLQWKMKQNHHHGNLVIGCSFVTLVLKTCLPY